MISMGTFSWGICGSKRRLGFVMELEQLMHYVRSNAAIAVVKKNKTAYRTFFPNYHQSSHR